MINTKETNAIAPNFIELIAQWHYDRQLIQNSTNQAQYLKLISECGELADNIGKSKDIKDDIGDIIVVLVNIAERNGITIEQCLEQAYHDIKDRTGHMSSAGVFVKD